MAARIRSRRDDRRESCSTVAMARRSDVLLRLIAAMKLAKAAALIAVAFGLLSHQWLHDLHPNNHYVRDAVARILDMSPHARDVVAIATFGYAALFVVEGVGLMLDKLWAEYMTTLVTMSFIPIELYELIERGSVPKAAVLVIN